MSKRTFDEYSSNINDYYSIVGNCGRQENASGKFSDDRMQTESSDDFMDVNMLKEKVSSMDEDETTSNLLNIEPHLPDFVHMMDSKKRKIDLESSIQQSLDSFEDLFFKAINNGDLDCLLLLLQQVPSDFDINMPNHIHPFKDQPALHIACNCGYTDFLKLLLEHFRSTLNINLENSKGSRSIHFAAYGGSLQILITLVGYVAQCSNYNQSTGKEFIFKGRNTEIYITSHNARVIHEFVNSKTNDENQRTPLIIATEKGNTDAVQFLLGLDKALREACPELKDATTVGTQGSYLPIHKAASRNNTEIIQLLLEHNPKSVNAKTSKRKYPLYFAVKRGATCIVEVLLKYGASTREYTPSGKKLLHIAAFINNLDICKLLVEQPDCDLDANTNDGHPRTALHLAAKKGHCEIISLLLSKGANVECVDYFGRYPIHVAASSGSIEATNMLACINGKDYINSKNSTGITCLHFACASGHTEMIPFLKSKGFNFREAKDDRCIRPIYVAAAQNQQNVVLELAKHYKKDINYINSQTGLSPLHIAIARDSFSAVEALIESGADIYQPSGSGMSAIALAKHKNNTRLQTILNRIIRSE